MKELTGESFSWSWPLSHEKIADEYWTCSRAGFDRVSGSGGRLNGCSTSGEARAVVHDRPVEGPGLWRRLLPGKGRRSCRKSPAGEPLWTPRPQWRDGQPQELPSDGGRASTYLFRTITTDKAAQASAGLGSDDGLEVWLNGKKLLSKDVARGVSPNDDTVILDLQAGENRLLLKIHNQSGGHGFFFELGPSQTSLAPRSAREFPVLRGMPSTRAAIEDLIATYGGKYSKGQEFLGRLTELEKALKEAEAALAGGNQAAKQRIAEMADKFAVLQRDALLANPLLDFDKLLLVKRGAGNLGLPQNWQANCGIGSTGLRQPDRRALARRSAGQADDADEAAEVGVRRRSEARFRRRQDALLDARQSMTAGRCGRSRPTGAACARSRPATNRTWTTIDPCYLPDGRILFTSSRAFQGVPCVGGGDNVANLCIMNADGSGIRQLCFDQDQNWCPTVLNDGRVLYTRWEYSDTPHYFTRLLFHMNPDGSGQMAHYRSNSYWPNSIFYAKPMPGHPTKLIAVISGHHGVPRMGELILFDPAQGRFEADGAVQRIPGNGRKVEPIIRDGLVDGSWPKFLHPYPLSDKYFLVSSQPTPQSKWGIYLVDVFDNMTLVKEEDGYVLFEPIPLRKTTRPPVIPDRIDLAKKDATVYLADIYSGPGLKGVPRGTVKKLRLYEPHFAYPGMGGHINIGIDGPWDVHRILGTVPVEADGSASFKVPANTPVAVQPLDAEGKALQLMRSWYTAMPGESLLLRRLPRHAELDPAGQADDCRPAPALGHHALVRPGAGLQFQARGAAGAGQILRGLPQGGCAAAKRPGRARLYRQETERLAQLHAFLHRLASLRAPARAGERLPPAEAAGVPRRYERTGADAQARALQREARRRGLGPAHYLDRPERARPRHLDGARRRPAARHGAASGDARQIRQPHGRSGEDPGSRKQGADQVRRSRADARAQAAGHSAWPVGLSTPPRRPSGKRP